MISTYEEIIEEIIYEEEISEENEIEESEEDLLVEEDDVSAFLQEPEEIVVETEENKITFSEVHELNLTKMGENAFTYLTLRKKDVDDGKYPGFNYVENVHRIKLKEKQYEVGGFFNANAENTVKQIMGKGVNNAGGDPNFYSSIGYQNWSKE